MFGQDPTVSPAVVPAATAAPVSSSELATTMVLRAAVGALAGAAGAPRGREGVWGVAGFFLGATLGQVGIVAILGAALWKKAE
jgi:hypothetical protein